MRLRAPITVALLAALLALGFGLWSLQRIFGRERADALAAIDGRRLLLAQYATTSLGRALQARLEGAARDIAAAVADPLAPEDGLYLARDGDQVLPRVPRARPGDTTPARDLHRRVGAGEVVDPSAEGPWAERLALAARFLDALSVGDDAAVEQAVRALLAHRVAFRVAAERDLPLMIALLERFVASGRPDPTLLRSLLHDGLSDRQGNRLAGLQRALLARREVFTVPEFTYLSGRVSALSVAAGAPVDGFDARARSAMVGALDVGPVDAPTLALGGRWFLSPSPDGAVRGVAIDAGAMLATLTVEMRDRGLLGPEDALSMAPFERVAADGVPLDVRSPAFAAAGAQAIGAWRAKTALAAVCAVLAVLLAGVAVGAQARRQRFLELKSDFVSTVSHELRTPLASIRVMAETLERRLADLPRARDYPTRIVRAADALGLMVENILSFNRIDRGRWVARREPVALAAALDAAHEHACVAAGRPVTWRVDGAQGVTLDGDPELITLLFQNLARNAARYNDRDPVCITVAVTRRDPLTVTVRDNGVGIPVDARRQLFTAFYRVPGRDARGSGLGLALCRRILALHQGRIDLTDSGPDGTTFTLRFGRSA
mgnify:CR=1 FL=1